MCGTPDFNALNTSALRLLGLGIAGLAGIAIHRAVRFFLNLRTRARARAFPAAERTGA
jgi:hypothetical protein